jgi:SAM-dependent methyltransferase
MPGIAYGTRCGALKCQKADLDVVLCDNCNHAFNRLFDNDIVQYNPDYDTSQETSPSFGKHLKGIAKTIIELSGSKKHCNVLEVGCGKGGLIRELKEMVPSQLDLKIIGFDPSCDMTSDEGNGIFIKKEFFLPSTYLPLTIDCLVARFILEHLENPGAFLKAILTREDVWADKRGLVLEVPSLEWILDNFSVGDFYYEHFSYFTRDSLRYFLNSLRITDIIISPSFNDRFLLATGNASPSMDAMEVFKLSDIKQKIFLFKEKTNTIKKNWLRVVSGEKNGILLWGAGSGGVSLANMLDPIGANIKGIVDIKESKWGKFSPGTGHKIISPVDIESDIDTIIVSNPGYIEEIREMAKQLAPNANVINIMDC